MSTTSPNFSFVLATTSDTVSVVSHVAGNFSAIDTLLSQTMTGTGQFKPSLVMSSPTITSPTLVGTLVGGNIVSTTGRFNTITATGGAITVNTLNVGTYSYPTTAGAAGTILTIVTGNAVFAANAPGTGAATDLGNLAAVVINTNLNAFTASVVTVTTLKSNTVTGTGGSLTGLAVMNATTGTFAANLTVIGTAHVGALNATGGTITAGGFAIGTYGYPSTAATTGDAMMLVTGNAVWLNQRHKVFEWIGNFTNSNSASALAGPILSPTITPVAGTSQFIFYAVQSSASQNIMTGQWIKEPGISTVDCYAYTWRTGDGQPVVKVTIGTMSASNTGVAAATATVNGLVSVDVSTIAANSSVPIVVGLHCSSNVGQCFVYLGAISMYGRGS